MLPFEIATPSFDPVLIATMTLVMIVVMIESTGMFLALSDITGKRISQQELSAGLRVDGLGTVIGGLFNTFPYTSFSQNVGLVGVTGVKSRYVCVAAGLIMMLLGMLPKMAALVESLPTFVLGGAGLVMFGMVAATGVRILASVDYRSNRQQPVHRSGLDRHRHDPAGRAQVPAVDAARHPSADRVGHPAGVDQLGAAEPVLQRRQGRRTRCDRGRQGRRGALNSARPPIPSAIPRDISEQALAIPQLALAIISLAAAGHRRRARSTSTA